jgi:hypothetical protein
MAENQPLNSPMRKLRTMGATSPRTSSPAGKLENLAEKERLALDATLRTQQQMQGLKAKFEQELASAQSQLEKQQTKSQKDFQDLHARQEQELTAYSAERNSIIKSIRSKPVIEQQDVSPLVAAVSAIKSEAAVIRSEFTTKFASFTTTFQAMRKSIQESLTEAAQKKLIQTPSAIQGRITQLRAIITQRCLSIEKAAAVPKLETSSPCILLDVPLKEDPKLTYTTVGTQILERVTYVRESDSLTAPGLKRPYVWKV